MENDFWSAKNTVPAHGNCKNFLGEGETPSPPPRRLRRLACAAFGDTLLPPNQKILATPLVKAKRLVCI
jgi:hypothetical protein